MKRCTGGQLSSLRCLELDNRQEDRILVSIQMREELKEFLEELHVGESINTSYRDLFELVEVFSTLNSPILQANSSDFELEEMKEIFLWKQTDSS